MSNPTIETFIDKVERDDTLRQRVWAAKSLDEIVRLANEAGFGFNNSQWQSSLTQKTSSELTNKELEQVAGGAGSVAQCTCVYDPDGGLIFMSRSCLYHSRYSGKW